MMKWRELSIEKRFFAVFVLQNITLIGFAFCIDGEQIFMVLFPCTIAIFIWISGNSFKFNHKPFIVFSICISLFWLHTHSWYLINNFNVNYDDLKDYSGETYNSMSKHASGHLVLKNKLEESKDIAKAKASGKEVWTAGERWFDCTVTADESCYKEITKYFSVENLYGHNISIKYAEFFGYEPVVFIIPSTTYKQPIYEVKHNGNILYTYDYFINKYSQEKKGLKIFAIYLIINSFGFCIFYQLIQKDFLKHSI